MLAMLDTAVVLAAVLGPAGASRYLLRQVGLGHLSAAASVPLMLEYEAALKRSQTLKRAGGSVADMDVILDQLAETNGHI
jgi:predicted nucleic acid-binding protein